MISDEIQRVFSVSARVFELDRFSGRNRFTQNRFKRRLLRLVGSKFKDVLASAPGLLLLLLSPP